MTIEPLPLLELFTRLRDAGLPLGTDEYQLVLKALQGGFGLDDRAALQQLCETLWIKNNEEKQLLVHHFNQLFPLEFESSGIPSTTLRSQKQIWKNPGFYLLATILCGTSILGTRLVMPEAESLTGIEVIGAPLDNQINGNAPVEPIDNNLPQEVPETVTQQELPRWIWWMIICSVTVPSTLLITWSLFQIFLEQNSPTQKKESSDTFSRAPQTIEDEIEAARAHQSFLQNRQKRFWRNSHYLPITQRQMKRSWQYLSRPVREGVATQFDIEATIERIGQEGLFLEPVLVPPRTNRAELMLLIDQDGSMVPFHKLTERLITTAQRGGRFAKVHIYYFHNCPVGHLYQDAICLENISFQKVFGELHFNDLSALIVSDAGANRNGYNPYRIEKTKNFLTILSRHVRHTAWINPVPKERWSGNTAAAVAKIVPMFSCNRPGLDKAIEILRGRK